MTYHLTTLPNGLRLMTVPLHDTQAVTVFVFTKVGSRYESRRLNGAAHFIEHMMFKGTERRPTTFEVTKLLDGVGASFNAFTDKEWTGYFVKIQHAQANLALDIVSDILQHSKFDPAEINRERGVITEEIKMYEENPTMAIGDLLDAAVYGDHHPLGWDIAGPKQNIKKLSRDDLIRFRNRYYHAGNMLVVVAGRLPPRLMDKVTEYFGTVKRRPTTPKFVPYKTSVKMPIKLKTQALEQVQIGLGVRAYRHRDPRLPALNVLAVILGASFSSRLFIEVRERRGLAYDISATAAPYQDTGSFIIHAGLEKSRVDEALSVIVAELKKLKTKRVPAEELNRAKEFIRGKTILGLEDSDSLAVWYGRQALFMDKILTPEEVLKKVARVTAADVQRAAQHLFRPSQMRLAAIGPFKETAGWAKILRQV